MDSWTQSALPIAERFNAQTTYADIPSFLAAVLEGYASPAASPVRHTFTLTGHDNELEYIFETSLPDVGVGAKWRFPVKLQHEPDAYRGSTINAIIQSLLGRCEETESQQSLFKARIQDAEAKAAELVQLQRTDQERHKQAIEELMMQVTPVPSSCWARAGIALRRAR